MADSENANGSLTAETQIINLISSLLICYTWTWHFILSTVHKMTALDTQCVVPGFPVPSLEANPGVQSQNQIDFTREMLQL